MSSTGSSLTHLDQPSSSESSLVHLDQTSSSDSSLIQKVYLGIAVLAGIAVLGGPLLLAAAAAVTAVSVILVAFLVEGIVEGVYLCLRKLRLRYKDDWANSTSETTSLLSNEELPFSQPRRHAQPVCGYQAFDIDATRSTDFQGGTTVADLPVRLVQLPRDDLSEVAVVSWRWDFDDEGRSRNLASAIKYAQTAGIRYLFADRISIDQNLDPRDLIQQILQFAELYKTIPVICAYDQPNWDLHDIMRRPWIFFETRLLVENPMGVMYVSHNGQGASVEMSAFSLLLGRPAKSAINRTRFAKELMRSWRSGFVTTVLAVLYGATSMTEISDFKYIIPGLMDVLTAAERLQRDDYLLTAALLAGASNDGRTEYQFESNKSIKLNYEEYIIKTTVDTWDWQTRGEDMDDPGDEGTKYTEIRTIFLRGGTERLARFQYIDEDWDGKKHKGELRNYTFTVLQNIEQNILTMLGLARADRTKYVTQQKQRVISSRPSNVQRRPRLDVVTVDI